MSSMAVELKWDRFQNKCNPIPVFPATLRDRREKKRVRESKRDFCNLYNRMFCISRALSLSLWNFGSSWWKESEY